MGLEDLLKEKLAVKAQAETRKVEEAHAKTYAGLNEKVLHLQEVLGTLKITHESAHSSVGEAKKESRALRTATGEVEKLFQNEGYAALLEADGVGSVADLLSSPTYGDEVEVVAVKNLKTSTAEKKTTVKEGLKERRSAKRVAQESIAQQATIEAMPLSYEAISSALERVIADLDTERQRLFLQTPEGQAARKSEILEKIKGYYNAIHPYPTVVSSRSVVSAYAPQFGDRIAAKKYGEEPVKDASREMLHEVVDKSLLKQEEESGGLKMDEAIETLEGLPDRWNSLQESLSEVQKSKAAIIEKLTGFLGDDPKAPLFHALDSYFLKVGGVYKDPKELATAFVKSMSDLEGANFGLRPYSQQESVESVIAPIITKQRGVAQSIRLNSQEIFRERKDPYGRTVNEAPLQHPERIGQALSKQKALYEKFQAALTTPEEVLKLSGKGFDGLLKELRLPPEKQPPTLLTFDAKTTESLLRENISNIKEKRAKTKQTLESQAKVIKKAIDNKVERDWAQDEEREFSSEAQNYKILQGVAAKMRVSEPWAALYPVVETAALQLEDADQKVVFDERYGMYFESGSPTRQGELQKLMAPMRERIKAINASISSIDGRAKTEGDGMLGGKRRARESEKTNLEAEKTTVASELAPLEADLASSIARNEKLGAVRAALQDQKSRGALELPTTPMTLAEFANVAKERMNVELSEEELRVFETEKGLRQKSAEADKAYEESLKAMEALQEPNASRGY